MQVSSYNFFFDYIIRIFDLRVLAEFEPVFPILGVLVVVSIGIVLVTGIWRNEKKELERNHETAYESVIIKGFAGIGLIFSIMFHVFIPIVQLGPEPLHPITSVLGSSLLAAIELGVVGG